MRRVGLFLLLLLALMAPALPLLAEEASPSTASEDFAWQDYQDPALERRASNPVADTASFLLKLGAVIGLIYGLAWLYRKGMLPRTWVGGGAPIDGARRLRVLETLSLRGGQSLHVVEAGDRLLVLGSNGKETLVKLAELPPGGFDLALQGEETTERFFSDELDSTIRKVVRPERGAP